MKNIFKNSQRGFTLVEILVVIVIIGILFTVILPRIDFAGDRARQKGIQTDFRSYQLATESVFKEYAGEGVTVKGLNSYLDEALTFTPDTTAISTTAYTPLTVKSKLDPWKNPYKYFVVDKPGAKAQAIVQSAGKDGVFTAVPTTGAPVTTSDDFFLVTYYLNGTVDSCTIGFEASEMKLSAFPSGGPASCGAFL